VKGSRPVIVNNRGDLTVDVANSTTVTYRDSLHYVTGNPRLKPTVIDAFTFGVNHRGFDLSLGYRIYRDQIYWECFPDDSNPNITIDTYGNRKEKNRVFIAELSYSFNHPVFSCMTGIDCRKSSLSLPFNNEILRFNRPVYSVEHSGNLKFLKNTSLNYEFRRNGQI
jgi:hypothetical protein